MYLEVESSTNSMHGHILNEAEIVDEMTNKDDERCNRNFEEDSGMKKALFVKDPKYIANFHSKPTPSKYKNMNDTVSR